MILFISHRTLATMPIFLKNEQIITKHSLQEQNSHPTPKCIANLLSCHTGITKQIYPGTLQNNKEKKSYKSGLKDAFKLAELLKLSHIDLVLEKLLYSTQKQSKTSVLCNKQYHSLELQLLSISQFCGLLQHFSSDSMLLFEASTFLAFGWSFRSANTEPSVFLGCFFFFAISVGMRTFVPLSYFPRTGLKTMFNYVLSLTLVLSEK